MSSIKKIIVDLYEILSASLILCQALNILAPKTDIESDLVAASWVFLNDSFAWRSVLVHNSIPNLSKIFPAFCINQAPREAIWTADASAK